MRSRKIDLDVIRRRLSRTQRVVAYARPPLVAFLRARLASLSASPRLFLMGVVDCGSDHALLCSFTVEGDRQVRSFLAPLSQISFGLASNFHEYSCAKQAESARLEDTPTPSRSPRHRLRTSSVI